MYKIIGWIKLHPKISLWIGFIIVLIFYNEDNLMGRLVEIPAKLYFFYILYLIIKWLFGFQGIGQEGSSNEIFPTSGTQGKVGKVRRGIRRARRMKR